MTLFEFNKNTFKCQNYRDIFFLGFSLYFLQTFLVNAFKLDKLPFSIKYVFKFNISLSNITLYHM